MTTSLASLRDLSASASDLLFEFRNSTVPSLVQEYRAQISAQEERYRRIERERVVELEHRVRAAKEKVVGLGKRMESLDQTLDAWEKREEQEKEKGRRVGLAWLAAGALILLVVLVLSASQRYRGAAEDADRHTRSMKRLAVGTRNFEASFQEISPPVAHKHFRETDPLERTFDEL